MVNMRPLSQLGAAIAFQVTSGSNLGNTKNLVLKKARRPGDATAWRFNFAPSLEGFISLTVGGKATIGKVVSVK